jgi:hypothetical protein
MIDTAKLNGQHDTTEEWIEDEDENEFRSRIFQLDDRTEVLVPVPEWKRKVLVKRLSGTARAEYFTFQLKLEEECQGTPEYWKRMWFELARLGCLHPKTKRPIFKMADRGTWMDEHDGGVIEMLGRTVQVFSQLDGSLAAIAKKNLEPTQSSIDTTRSQNSLDTSA